MLDFELNNVRTWLTMNIIKAECRIRPDPYARLVTTRVTSNYNLLQYEKSENDENYIKIAYEAINKLPLNIEARNYLITRAKYLHENDKYYQFISGYLGVIKRFDRVFENNQTNTRLTYNGAIVIFRNYFPGLWGSQSLRALAFGEERQLYEYGVMAFYELLDNINRLDPGMTPRNNASKANNKWMLNCMVIIYRYCIRNTHINFFRKFTNDMNASAYLSNWFLAYDNSLEPKTQWLMYEAGISNAHCDNLPKVSLSLSFCGKDSEMKNDYEWCRHLPEYASKNFNILGQKKVLPDFKMIRIGELVMECNGLLHDLSEARHDKWCFLEYSLNPLRSGLLKTEKLFRFCIVIIYAASLILTLTLSIYNSSILKNYNVDPTSLTSMIAVIIALLHQAVMALYADEMTMDDFIKGRQRITNITPAMLQKLYCTRVSLLSWLMSGRSKLTSRMMAATNCLIPGEKTGDIVVPGGWTADMLLRAGYVPIWVKYKGYNKIFIKKLSLRGYNKGWLHKTYKCGTESEIIICATAEDVPAHVVGRMMGGEDWHGVMADMYLNYIN
jgi:hypothetical protein